MRILLHGVFVRRCLHFWWYWFHEFTLLALSFIINLLLFISSPLIVINIVVVFVVSTLSLIHVIFIVIVVCVV